MKKNISKIFFISLICAVLLSALCIQIFAEDFTYDLTHPMRDEIPYGNPVEGLSNNGYETKAAKTIYSSDEAEDAGVPEGYEGYVLELKGNSEIGVTIDFSDKKVPAALVKGVKFRYYTSSNVTELRVTVDAGYGWVLRHPVNVGEWDEYELLTDGSDFDNKTRYSIKNMTTEEGYFGVFQCAFRANGTATVYIDSITLVHESNDHDAPVITYEGDTNIITSAGKPFVPGATAYDEFEGAEKEFEYIWSDESALDENGLLCKGEYDCRLVAKDFSGNTSELTLHVRVDDKDTQPPVINFPTEEVRTYIGAYPVFDFTATDNYDKIDVYFEWSDGALDQKGRLTEGTHTLRLVAEDLTGNISMKDITFIVSDDPEKGQPTTTDPVKGIMKPASDQIKVGEAPELVKNENFVPWFVCVPFAFAAFTDDKKRGMGK